MKHTSQRAGDYFRPEDFAFVPPTRLGRQPSFIPSFRVAIKLVASKRGCCASVQTQSQLLSFRLLLPFVDSSSDPARA